jgi:hypothetical protein
MSAIQPVATYSLSTTLKADPQRPSSVLQWQVPSASESIQGQARTQVNGKVGDYAIRTDRGLATINSMVVQLKAGLAPGTSPNGMGQTYSGHAVMMPVQTPDIIPADGESGLAFMQRHALVEMRRISALLGETPRN